MSKPHLDVEIVSDVVCPWCYLGQRRLQLAIDEVREIVDVATRWKPYQLDPTVPEEGYDTFEYLARKIGGAEAVRRSHATLTQLGAEIGLPFALEKAKVFPNTLDAHRLLHWAGAIGPEMQNTVAHALFSANFVDGLNVGDHETLVKIAADAGMDGKLVENRLASPLDMDKVHGEIANAQQMGVTGVPCFIIDRQYAISGAQPTDVFVNAFRKLAELKQNSSEKSSTSTSPPK